MNMLETNGFLIINKFINPSVAIRYQKDLRILEIIVISNMKFQMMIKLNLVILLFQPVMLVVHYRCLKDYCYH